MLAVMELDLPHNPRNILIFRAVAVVALANLRSDEVDEAWFRSMLHNKTAAFDDIWAPWSI